VLSELYSFQSENQKSFLLQEAHLLGANSNESSGVISYSPQSGDCLVLCRVMILAENRENKNYTII
jgi:hypothetical protein